MNITKTFINSQTVREGTHSSTSNILPISPTPTVSLSILSLSYPASSYEASIESEATALEAMIGDIVKLNLRHLYKIKIDMIIDRIAILRGVDNQRIACKLAHKFELEVL